MIGRNGARLAAREFGGQESVAAAGFYQALWKYSRVGCEAPRTRRKYGTKASITSQWQQTCPFRSQSRFLALRIMVIPLGQGRSCISTSASAGTDAETTRLAEKSDDLVYSAVATELQDNEREDEPKPIPDIPMTGKLLTKNGAILRKKMFQKRLAAEREAKAAPGEAKPEDEVDAALSDDVRTLMRTLPSTVVVLTTASSLEGFLTPDKEFRPCRGMTLSSFSSLTLSPHPRVMFNIRSPSRTLDTLITTGHFFIHILESNPEGARIADHFTKGNGSGEDFVRGAVFREGISKELFGVQYDRISDNELTFALPRLIGRGVKRVLRCTLQREVGMAKNLNPNAKSPHDKRIFITVGDHFVVFGRVVEILARDGLGEVDGGYGLSYVDGEYRQVGESILLEVADSVDEITEVDVAS